MKYPSLESIVSWYTLWNFKQSKIINYSLMEEVTANLDTCSERKTLDLIIYNNLTNNAIILNHHILLWAVFVCGDSILS